MSGDVKSRSVSPTPLWLRDLAEVEASEQFTRPRQATAQSECVTFGQSLDWRSPTEAMRRYRVRLVLLDFLAGVIGAVTGYIARFGVPDAVGTMMPYLLMSSLLPVVWIAFVALNRVYEPQFLGLGASEFQRIFYAFLALLAVVAVVAYAAKFDLARGYVVLALPTVLVVDLLLRYGARKHLHRRRLRGQDLCSVVVVGTVRSVVPLVAALRRDRYAGLQVVGACLVSKELDAAAAAALGEHDIAYLGSVDDIRTVLPRVGAHTVAVTSSSEVGPERLRWIAWLLEGSDVDLLVSPGLVEVAGTRLHVRPVAGLPLLNVRAPEFRGFRRLLKGVFDRVSAALALIVLAPLLLAIGAAVALTSPGGAIFCQVRIGKGGRPFCMYKFRTMRVGAESEQATLMNRNQGAGPLFKLHADPRVTRVGRVLREYSLDELPQLVNVLLGSMSLVGPRPPLPSEVDSYGPDVRRRLLVKPGLTGLWQVSGRSNLSWEESVQLDLRYVENWSIATDLLILWKTVWAVAGCSGAY